MAEGYIVDYYGLTLDFDRSIKKYIDKFTHNFKEDDIKREK